MLNPNRSQPWFEAKNNRLGATSSVLSSFLVAGFTLKKKIDAPDVSASVQRATQRSSSNEHKSLRKHKSLRNLVRSGEFDCCKKLAI